jgi:hypothetical protein
MRTLQEQLCLKRPNFQINPKQSAEDAQLYFGTNRNHEMIERIETGYMAAYVPRFYILGNYGHGKTHLLYHLKHHFDESNQSPKVLAVIVQVEAETRSRFQTLHKRLLDAIGIDRIEKTYVDYGFQSGANREARFREIFSNENAYKVMQSLTMGPSSRTLAWRWLTGDRLSNADMTQLGVTEALLETGELVELLVAIGELFRRTGTNLLFLIDEAESLGVVEQRDAQRSWHDAFRRLADTNDNQSVGWIITFYAQFQDDAPTFMAEADITTRLGKDGIRVLEPLQKVEVKQFLAGLLSQFVDRDKAAEIIKQDKLNAALEEYPFTRDGLAAFVEHAGAAAEHSIPRTILRAVTACALEALHRDKRVFDAALVNDVVPGEFTQL